VGNVCFASSRITPGKGRPLKAAGGRTRGVNKVCSKNGVSKADKKRQGASTGKENYVDKRGE